jgi:16S rRNA (guanine966-N2)-methyltransferase
VKGPQTRAGAAPPGFVRIVGGRFKRSKLPVPAVPGLRPTPDRVRETLFNWLGAHLDGWRCIDAFAGTGALGLEAASRGAVEVVLVERERRAAEALESNARRLGAQTVRVVRDDAIAWMSRAEKGRFDVVFLDPPFGSGLAEPALAAALPLVADDGSIYVESPGLVNPPAGWIAHRRGRAGKVHFALLRREPSADPG